MAECVALCDCNCCAEKTDSSKSKMTDYLKNASMNSVFESFDDKSKASCPCVDSYKESLKNENVLLSKSIKKENKSFILKALTAIAGFMLLGSGQVINGDWTKAALFAFLMPVLTKFVKINPAVKTTLQKMLKFIACFDAYKNA